MPVISFSVRRDKFLTGNRGALSTGTAFYQMQAVTLQGAQMVAQRMAALAPKDTGALSRSVRAEVLPRRGRNPASAAISKDRGEGARKSKAAVKRKKKVWYGWPVEKGHFVGRPAFHKFRKIRKAKRTQKEALELARTETRTFVPPQAFARPAVRQTRPQVLAIIRNGLQQIINAAR